MPPLAWAGLEVDSSLILSVPFQGLRPVTIGEFDSTN
jgi:hypothetical protein